MDCGHATGTIAPHRLLVKDPDITIDKDFDAKTLLLSGVQPAFFSPLQHKFGLRR